MNGSHFVYRKDVGVFQSGNRFRLLTEALQLNGRRQPGRMQHLESDRALQAQVSRFVHHTHTPAAQFFDELIVSEALQG